MLKKSSQEQLGQIQANLVGIMLGIGIQISVQIRKILINIQTTSSHEPLAGIY